MKKVVIIQPSLREQSFTHLLCTTFAQYCEKLDEISVDYIDLRERNLEFCDGRELVGYSDEMQKDYQLVKSADVVIFGFPVYHFAITGVLKNYIDILGDSLQDKKVDFLVTALLEGCEMSYEHIIESLWAKYHVTKLMSETVYVLNSSFAWSMIMDMKARKTMQELVKNI